MTDATGRHSDYAIDQMIKFVMPAGKLYRLMDKLTNGPCLTAPGHTCTHHNASPVS